LREGGIDRLIDRSREGGIVIEKKGRIERGEKGSMEGRIEGRREEKQKL
jgi:hypothetical protein